MKFQIIYFELYSYFSILSAIRHPMPFPNEERRLELIDAIDRALLNFSAKQSTTTNGDGRRRFSMRIGSQQKQRQAVQQQPRVPRDDLDSSDDEESGISHLDWESEEEIDAEDATIEQPVPTGRNLLGLSAKLTAFRLRALAQVYELLVTNRHATKRNQTHHNKFSDLFYECKSLYKTQPNFDRALTAVCKFLNASRAELHVISCSKGFAIGDLRLYNAIDETELDFRAGGTPVALTEALTHFDFAHSGAKFVLIVEKDAVFQRLMDEQWSQKFPNSILLTGRGYPDICTRQFLSWLALKFPKMPFVALMDADPYGIEIFLTYKFGSARSRVESGDVQLPRLQWIGFLPSEAEQLQLPADQFLPLSAADKRRIEKIGQRVLAHGEEAIFDELSILLANNWKLEIEAICTLGPQFLSSQYLNYKLDQFLLIN